MVQLTHEVLQVDVGVGVLVGIAPDVCVKVNVGVFVGVFVGVGVLEAVGVGVTSPRHSIHVFHGPLNIVATAANGVSIPGLTV